MSKIVISDSKGKTSTFKVKVIASNGKSTGHDKGFNSVKAVNKHLQSNNRTWGGIHYRGPLSELYARLGVVDATAKQLFVKYGAVLPKPKRKPSPKKAKP